jgi:hypothetical protein
MRRAADIEPRAVGPRRVRELSRDDRGDRSGAEDAAIIGPGGIEPRAVGPRRMREVAQ